MAKSACAKATAHRKAQANYVKNHKAKHAAAVKASEKRTGKTGNKSTPAGTSGKSSKASGKSGNSSPGKGQHGSTVGRPKKAC